VSSAAFRLPHFAQELCTSLRQTATGSCLIVDSGASFSWIFTFPFVSWGWRFGFMLWLSQLKLSFSHFTLQQARQYLKLHFTPCTEKNRNKD